MDQTVMSFAGTAARGSAIPTPVEGMYTHLEDTDRLDFWNGSAWVSASGTNLLRTVDFTAQTSVAVDNVFTSEFDTYKVTVTQIATAVSNLDLRLRTSGSADINTADYQTQFLEAASSSVTGARVNAANQYDFTTTRTFSTGFSEVTIANPLNASSTSFISNFIDPANSANTIQFRMSLGRYSPDTAASGFRIFVGSGTITGKLSVYGLRK